MWVQHHNGIFVSSNEGKNFTEVKSVEPSVFGFPVAVHPKDPDTVWFVPEIKDEKRVPREGKLVVTRTRVSGAKCGNDRAIHAIIPRVSGYGRRKMPHDSGKPAIRKPSANLARSAGRRMGCLSVRLEMRSAGSIWRSRSMA